MKAHFQSSRRRLCRAALLLPLLTGRAALALPVSGARSSWPAWEAFRASAIKEGRVIDAGSGSPFTTSEGEAYALFFALAANDRPTFDAVLAWTDANLCGGFCDETLPAWRWGELPAEPLKSGRGSSVKAEPRFGITDTNNASDADLWIAYALLEGGRLWQDPELTRRARVLMERLKKEVRTVPELGRVLLPGRGGFERADGVTLNPSYTPLFLLRRLADEEPAFWRPLYEGTVRMLIRSAPDGISPDWVTFDRMGKVKPDPNSVSSYDAVRVYMWAGMLSEDSPERALLVERFRPMTELIHARRSVPVRVNVTTGEAEGTGSGGFAAAMLPLMGNTRTGALLRAAAEDTPIGADSYYSSVLVLFGCGFADRRFGFDANGRLISAAFSDRCCA